MTSRSNCTAKKSTVLTADSNGYTDIPKKTYEFFRSCYSWPSSPNARSPHRVF